MCDCEVINDKGTRGYVFSLLCPEHTDDDLFMLMEDVRRHPEYQRCKELELDSQRLVFSEKRFDYVWMYAIPMDYKTWLNARATERAIVMM